MATQKQMVADLQAELQKAKKEVQLAREATEAEKKASYQLSVKETKISLTKELSEVCRDYYDVTWDKTLTAARVLADSALRLPRSIYYHPQIHEIPFASSPPAPTPESSGNLWQFQIPSLLLKFKKNLARLVIKVRGLKKKKARTRTKGRSHQPRPKMPPK